MSKRTALVTGATGLLGRQVVEAFQLSSATWEVKGTGHSRADGVDVLKVDLGSEAEIARVLDQVKSVTYRALEPEHLELTAIHQAQCHYSLCVQPLPTNCCRLLTSLPRCCATFPRQGRQGPRGCKGTQCSSDKITGIPGRSQRHPCHLHFYRLRLSGQAWRRTI